MSGAGTVHRINNGRCSVRQIEPYGAACRIFPIRWRPAVLLFLDKRRPGRTQYRVLYSSGRCHRRATRRNSGMGRISRRQAIQGAAATAVATTLGTPSVHAQKDQQTLRFVPHAELKILDPVWTTGYISRNHGYLVYDRDQGRPPAPSRRRTGQTRCGHRRRLAQRGGSGSRASSRQQGSRKCMPFREASLACGSSQSTPINEETNDLSPGFGARLSSPPSSKGQPILSGDIRKLEAADVPRHSLDR